MRTRRIAEVAARQLVEKFSPSNVSVHDPDSRSDVVVSVDGQEHSLSRADAAELRAQLGEALAGREEFLHTACEHREDGSYVVERRGADSAGHRKVFERFGDCRALYDRLPAEFTAANVGGTGLTGGRRHLLVRHFTEHPAFDCELVSRQPLTARKRSGTAGEDPTAQEEPASTEASAD